MNDKNTLPSANESTGMPIIDDRVEHVGVSRLRKFDGKTLKQDMAANKAFVIKERNQPLAVLLGYEQYLIIQNKLKAVMETLEIISNSEETQMLIAGLREAAAGQTRSLQEIRTSINHHSE